MQNAITSASVPCPVCAGATVIHDVVDFNKNCEESRQLFLPLSGRPVYYHRCPACGFVLAPEFAEWSDQDFEEQIYNAGYIEVDPEYASKRPLATAEMLHKMFGSSRAEIRHLDYGGGSGLLSATLRAQGWDSRSYDPFPRNQQQLGAQGKFNLISAFEVFEHVPDVNALMENLNALMEEQCLVVFSTMLTDGYIKPNTRLTWWYASPRNGHISLFSKQSLIRLAQRHQLQFGSFDGGTHCLFRQLPDWAKKLLA